MPPIVLGYLAPIPAGHEVMLFKHAEWVPAVVGYVLHTDPIVLDLTTMTLYGGRKLPPGLSADNIFEQLPLVDPHRGRLVDDVADGIRLVHRKHYRAEEPRRVTVACAVVRSDAVEGILLCTELYVEDGAS